MYKRQGSLNEDQNCLNMTDMENKHYVFTFLNTNARSLSPKMNSLLDCFEEMDAAFAVVTKTWFSDGRGLVKDAKGL